MRAHIPFILFLLACVLWGCGDDRIGALRVDLETFASDGDLPTGLRLRRVDPGTDEGAGFDLRPVPGGRRGEYEAPGAPDGSYVVEGPAGWWMLSESGAAPRLVRGLQPPLVALGRGRAVYLTPQAEDVRPASAWGAVRIGPDGGEESVPVRVDADERGYVVALRFAPEDWRGTLEIVGRIAIGPPPTLPTGPDAPLAKPLRFEPTPDGRPPVFRVKRAASGPFEVVLVPASAEVTTEGLRVVAATEGLPIPAVVEAYGRRGVARLLDVPIMDRMLRVEVDGLPGRHVVAPEDRRRQANLRLLVTGKLPLRRVRLLPDPEDDAALDVDIVLVRPAGAVAYGRVPLERVDGGFVLAAPTGPLSLLVRSGTRWSSGSGGGLDDLDLHFELANFHEGVVVGGNVDSAPPGAVVRFFREVHEREEAVLADGFEVRVEHGGAFEAHLPIGRYLVEVATRTGTWRRPAPLIAESAGARLHLPLESP